MLPILYTVSVILTIVKNLTNSPYCSWNKVARMIAAIAEYRL